jgi:hypothetical protein
MEVERTFEQWSLGAPRIKWSASVGRAHTSARTAGTMASSSGAIRVLPDLFGLQVGFAGGVEHRLQAIDHRPLSAASGHCASREGGVVRARN